MTRIFEILHYGTRSIVEKSFALTIFGGKKKLANQTGRVSTTGVHKTNDYITLIFKLAKNNSVLDRCQISRTAYDRKSEFRLRRRKLNTIIIENVSSYDLDALSKSFANDNNFDTTSVISTDVVDKNFITAAVDNRVVIKLVDNH